MQRFFSRRGDNSVISWNLLDCLPFHTLGEVSVWASQLVEVVKDQVGRDFNQLHLSCSVGRGAYNPHVAEVAVLSDIHLKMRQVYHQDFFGS